MDWEYGQHPRGLASVSKGLPADTLGFPCLISCSMIRFSDGLTNAETSDTYRKTLPSTLEVHFCNVLFRGDRQKTPPWGSIKPLPATTIPRATPTRSASYAPSKRS